MTVRSLRDLRASSTTQFSKVSVAFAAGVLLTAVSLVRVVPDASVDAGGQGAAFVEDFVPADQVPTDQVAAGPSGPSRQTIRRQTSAGSEGAGGDGVGGSGDGSAGSAGGGASASSGNLECAPGKNGGETDVGVTGSEIKLGATVAESGIARDFLGEARQAMEAVRKRINNAGGICGRKLTIVYKDDGWEADRGKVFIENLINQEKVFALAVVPSSEGLNQASTAGVFKSTGVPVIGSDGMIKSQYTDPYIWPVASSTTTQMHVMMKEAWDRGARHPAIVYENTYKFGVEGAYAFNQAFKRLSGHNIAGFGEGQTCQQRFCGIPSGSQYGNQVNSLNNACDSEPKCDFIALLLEPQTAQNWMAVTGAPTPRELEYGMGAAQPLFTRSFGVNCGDKCDKLRLWTGYNPPIEQFRSAEAVAKYVDELHSVSASADEFNQFTEGAYLGMQLLEAALTKVGPGLTRKALIAELDRMTLDGGLASSLTWSEGKHLANSKVQAFEINAKNGFTGWSSATPYIPDPWLGEDM